MLPLTFQASISGDKWHGVCNIPASYFPPQVTRFNAYAIHGSESAQQYEALYPAENGKHDQPDL